MGNRVTETFNIVRYLGEPQQTRTAQGKAIQRQESLFVLEWGAMVRCTPYDDHFIYEDDAVGQSAYMCTCGSPAGVVPPGPNGMFVCLFHAQYGKHTTSVVNVKDIESGKIADKVIEIERL